MALARAIVELEHEAKPDVRVPTRSAVAAQLILNEHEDVLRIYAPGDTDNFMRKQVDDRVLQVADRANRLGTKDAKQP